MTIPGVGRSGIIWLYEGYAESLFARILDQDGARLPSDRRYAARLRTPIEGITIPRSLHDTIASLRHP